MSIPRPVLSGDTLNASLAVNGKGSGRDGRSRFPHVVRAQRIVFRIGIDMDDIAVEDGDIYGMSARHRGADA